MNTFWAAFLPSILAVIVALIFDKKRFPKVAIYAEEEKVINTYQGRGTWNFVRFFVENTAMPWYLKWLPRQVAQNCSATLEFFNEDGTSLFIMRGRWANTPEMVHISPHSFVERTLFPDSISIFAGEREPLDCIVQKDGDSEAYGWNNEAYLNDWKTPHYKLIVGKYIVKVRVITQNGVSLIRKYDVDVKEDFKLTCISHENQMERKGYNVLINFFKKIISRNCNRGTEGRQSRRTSKRRSSIVGAIVTGIVTGFILNFLITWFSAPQLSMNMSGGDFAIQNEAVVVEKRIEIENRGDNVIGARVLVNIPSEYIHTKEVQTDLPFSRRLLNDDITYNRYQQDIGIPIIHDKTIIVGNMRFVVKNKKTKFNIPFEIYADKMAPRRGVIRLSVAKNGKIGVDSVSEAVIKKKDWFYVLLGRMRWHSIRNVRIK